MRGRTLRLLLEAVALSLLLTWLWLAGGRSAYEAFFAETARPLLHALGVYALPDSPARRRFVSVVPFLVLMLVTPGLAGRRRLGGILLGIPLLFLGHVALVAVEALAHGPRRSTADSFSTLLPAALFADALPFALWAIFCADVLVRVPRRRPGA